MKFFTLFRPRPPNSTPAQRIEAGLIKLHKKVNSMAATLESVKALVGRIDVNSTRIAGVLNAARAEIAELKALLAGQPAAQQMLQEIEDLLAPEVEELEKMGSDPEAEPTPTEEPPAEPV